MAIHTAACARLSIDHPVVQAGMARRYTTAALVAAVSGAGGLGILGGLGRSAAEVVAEMQRIRALTDRPFGVNFVVHQLDEAAFQACLAERPPVVVLFRGDPAGPAARAKAMGALVICQVTTAAEARHAVTIGADLLIAQGTEAGGHNGPIPLFGLLPQVLDVAGDCPVLAAGGIVDGRGLAAVLCLGAAGVVMGTRFLLTPECPVGDFYAATLAASRGRGTLASDVPDIIGGVPWPGVQARAIHNDLLSRWLGRESELQAQRERIQQAADAAAARGDWQETVVLAGMGADRIAEVRPAAEIVRQVVAEAEAVLYTLTTDHKRPARNA